MPKPVSLILDTTDDRRELHQLLERVPPAARVAWLAWCCRQVKGKHETLVKPRRGWDGANALEVWLDFWQLVVQYELDPTAAAAKLEAVARRQGVGRRLFAAG